MNIELIQICKEIIKISDKYNINKNATQYKELIFKETENFPHDISLSKRTIAIANNNYCKCKVCEKTHGHHDKDYCSHTCYIKNKKTNVESEELKIDKKINNAILKGEKTFKDAIENDDYLICKICGCKTGNIVNHIKYHTITLDDYKNEYDIKQIKTNKQIEKVTGVNNPAYQHGGKFSPYSDKFIYADTTNKKELVEQLIKTRTKNKNNTTSIDYWLKKTDGDNDLAQELLSNRQETFSKRTCIEKYGEIEGLQRWSDRQEKWIKNNKKNNYSKISQELFDSIIEKYSPDFVYFATYKRKEDEDKNNAEYKICCNQKWFSADFIDISKNKIIEFDGDYWHSEKRGNQKRDFERDKLLIENGYEILHIKERDYKLNKDNEIKRCINFLKKDNQ